MSAGIITLICFLGLNQLLPTDPTVHSDDFISVSCPDRRSCLILDNAGNVWFSPDGGPRLVHRSNQKQIGLVKIRFTGLIDGWGLDRRGGLWRTRNGGRSFLPISSPGGSPAVDIRGTATEIWLGTRNGSVFRLQQKKKATAIAQVRGATGLKLFDFDGKNLIAAVGMDGSLLVSQDRGKNWNRSQPLAGGVNGLAVNASGHIVVSGCRGAVATSVDSGKSFKTLKIPETPESWGSACLISGGFLADGRFLVFGIPQNVLVGSPDSSLLKNFLLPPQRNWRAAALLGNYEALLVGNGGARARLKAQGGRELEYNPVGTSLPTVTDIQTNRDGQVWVAFMNGEIRHSADGGRNWDTLMPPAGKLPIRLSFVDEKRGFILAGHHTILGTSDRGRSWQLLGKWPDTFLNDIFFFDSQNGWAVGKIGCVVHTTDGGKTWTLDRLPTDRDLNQLQFVDRNRGWAVGDKQAVFHTRDGGRTWLSMLAGRGSLYSLHFESSGEGWICGDAGIVQHTTDGGKSWTPQPTPTSETLRAISFPDASRGLVGGEGGRIFITKDGGASWKPLELNTQTRIVTIACDRRAARCLVGGDRGLLFSGAPFRFHP